VFIRKKKNKTGSTSVHIVQKINGRQIHVKAVGYTNDAAEIKKLEARAHQEISVLTQQGNLSFSYAEDEQHIEHLKSSIQSVQPDICICILEKLFYEIGFSAIGDPLFRHLVVMRLLYPVSKLKTVEYLYLHYQIHYDIDYVYRYMDKLHKGHQAQLQQVSFNHTKKILGEDMAVVFYDVTTLYFEAEQEDDLRKMGFSKDGKAQHPQIVLGLLVSTGGYPLAYEMFEGNKFEGKTILPVIEAFKKSYGLEKLVIIADAGLLSNDNIEQLISGGYEFILGARIKNEAEVIKKQILSLNLKDGQSIVIEKSNGLKLVVSYALARATKDEYNRKRGLQKLENGLKSGKLSKKHINNRGYNKYLKLEGEITIAIDYEKYKQDAMWDGLKGYLTNTQLPKETIIEHYKNLWQIEKAFRISKTDLRVRPIYHRLARRIKSHLNIAFCSYKLYKELERQLKLKDLSYSPEKAIGIMKSIYSIKTILPASQKQVDIIIVKEEQQKTLLNAFNISY
jgi:transposase